METASASGLWSLGVNLYVKHLEDELTEEQLREEFARYGAVSSAKIMRDAHGRSRGFGFVSFEDSEAGNTARHEMHGLFHFPPFLLSFSSTVLYCISTLRVT